MIKCTVIVIPHAVLGGVASVAGGGKFENAAITGAFGYMFNDAAHNCFSQCAADGAEIPNAQSVSVGPVEIAAAGFFGGIRAALGSILGSISSADSPEYADRVRQRALEDPVSHNFP